MSWSVWLDVVIGSMRSVVAMMTVRAVGAAAAVAVAAVAALRFAFGFGFFVDRWLRWWDVGWL